MEDAHLAVPRLCEEACAEVALFGVLDGHGGPEVARLCSQLFPDHIRQSASGRGGLVDGQRERGDITPSELKKILTDAFHGVDDLLRVSEDGGTEQPAGLERLAGDVDFSVIGCTCCLCCVTAAGVATANAGDSRAVLCRGGQALPLSEDHTPALERERVRVEAAGGCIVHHRVNGTLSVTRALGDFAYKTDRSAPAPAQVVCATPEVNFVEWVPEDEFVVICCDGVWERLSNQQVVDFVRTRLPVGNSFIDPWSLSAICEALLDACVSPNLKATRHRGGDNLTAVIVLRLRTQGTTSVGAASSSSQDRARKRPDANKHSGGVAAAASAASAASAVQLGDHGSGTGTAGPARLIKSFFRAATSMLSTCYRRAVPSAAAPSAAAPATPHGKAGEARSAPARGGGAS